MSSFRIALILILAEKLSKPPVAVVSLIHRYSANVRVPEHVRPMAGRINPAIDGGLGCIFVSLVVRHVLEHLRQRERHFLESAFEAVMADGVRLGLMLRVRQSDDVQVVTPLQRLEAAAVPIAAIGSELVRQPEGVLAKTFRLLQCILYFDDLQVSLVLVRLLLTEFGHIQRRL